MKRAIAVSLLAFSGMLMLQPAGAGEGRVSDSSPAVLEQGRVANYTRTAPEAASSSTKSSKVHTNAKATQAKVSRSAISQATSSRASYFFIFDAGSSLRIDRDRDGYHSEFQIRFDADSQIGDTLVYARLYLRRVGELDWQLYHTTDDFWIYGESDDDDYFVTTTLDDGFPTSEYDVLIDLYEVGYNGIVATIDASDDVDLLDLPLEEVGLDVPIEIPGYGIGNVSTTLLIDSDRDDHYSRFRITFDPDADFDGTYVYAKFWVRAQGGDWIEEHVSEDFLVDSSGTEDVYSLTADWVSGYPTAYYDVQIDLHDAATGGLVASAGSERPELSRIPLEDQARDTRVDVPSPGGGGGDTTSRERGGGGAVTIWLLLGMAGLAIGRWMSANRRQQRWLSSSFRLRAVVVAATGIWLSIFGANASAQSTRPYQMTTHAWIDPTNANVDIQMFSKGVFAEQPQPAGRSIAWLKVDANLDQWDIDWSRIVAVYVDEPYAAILEKNRKLPCDARILKEKGEALERMAAALRARAPAARFWVNFNEIEIDRSRRKGCTFNASYIDVISIDAYYVDFTPAVSDRYRWIYKHRPTDYQQLALIVPAFTGGTPPRKRSPQTPAQAVARMTQYLDYAARMNRTCHLPLGPTGMTRMYDGCPVWIVSGFLSGVRPPDDPKLMPIDNPASALVFDAWQAKFAAQRIDPKQVQQSAR